MFLKYVIGIYICINMPAMRTNSIGHKIHTYTYVLYIIDSHAWFFRKVSNPVAEQFLQTKT